MKKASGLILFAILAVVAIGCGQVIGCATVKGLVSKGYDTPTAAIYTQTNDGTYEKSLCRAIAFEEGRGENTYHFVTASDCVATNDIIHERARLMQKHFFIALNEDADTNYFAVKVIVAGYQPRGDNFAVLEVQLNKHIKTEPDLAKDPRFQKFWTEVKDGKYKWFSSE